MVIHHYSYGELMCFVFLPINLIPVSCVTELDTKDLFLCGLHGDGVYHWPFPLHGSLVN